MVSDSSAFWLRDAMQQLWLWRGRVVDIAIQEPEVGLFFAAFRATIETLELDPDLDGSGGRLQVYFREPGHDLVLYADLVVDVAVAGGWHMAIVYRGGNLEIELAEGPQLS